MTPEQVVYRSRSPRVVVTRGDASKGAAVTVSEDIYLRNIDDVPFHRTRHFDSWTQACTFAEWFITAFDAMRKYSDPEVQRLEARIRELRQEQEQKRNSLKDELRSRFNG